ncbi:hypothetical protein TMEN_5257 [Trichophyton mentagrophytes]|uniref:Uncharacterized protein n=1 Tax=Trichophyton interdigitale TaxID=101480 RepID=A0A9P5D141_9EURO|nr:hypothetical protein GY631_1219 [Trichophyton interdigitale]KAF3899929.1 hypothetical protein GY632_1037 [Trichophyton interdigitale]KAG8211954.1 hypothetical protein GTR04_0703 [Trichophyton interdigitale]GBF62693.1 hypothetical protein TMEN_5257 [Trichophyton mentagrophytes]
MAAVSCPMSPARQPFAVLGEARLRTANSIKNQQNGATANSLKRRLDVLDTSDAENIDPLLMGSPSKRSKGGIQVHQDTTDSIHIFTKPALPVKTPAKARSSNSEFITPARPIRGQSSLSAPLRAPAGRSPKSKAKSVKAFGRRSVGFCRVDPPTTNKRSMTRVPFSIADALNGTFTVSRPVAESTSSTTPKARRPKAWDFEIHADTEQDEMANLMQHSTCVLDISDDEEKQARETRGKENIPPSQPLSDGSNGSATAQQTSTTTARNVEMGDEPRSPLGELDVKAFIPEGEDINSVVIIPEDDDDTSAEQNSTTTTVEKSSDATQEKHSKPSVQSKSPLSKTEIASLLGRTAPKVQAEEQQPKEDSPATEIKTWEGSTATEEASTATKESDEPVEPSAPSSS